MRTQLRYELWKGMAAGVAGGLMGGWVMNRFQSWWSRWSHGSSRPHGAQSLQQGSPQRGVGRELRRRGNEEEGDNAAVRVASAVSEGAFHHRLKKNEKETAGAVSHYVMSATSGGIYGGVAELLPGATIGAGLPFGATVWLVADEIVVPALGLSKKPTEYPLSIHAYALASHLVYGLTTEMGRRALRSALR
jgi:putative membrane protein